MHLYTRFGKYPFYSNLSISPSLVLSRQLSLLLSHVLSRLNVHYAIYISIYTCLYLYGCTMLTHVLQRIQRYTLRLLSSLPFALQFALPLSTLISTLLSTFLSPNRLLLQSLRLYLSIHPIHCRNTLHKLYLPPYTTTTTSIYTQHYPQRYIHVAAIFSHLYT